MMILEKKDICMSVVVEINDITHLIDTMNEEEVRQIIKYAKYHLNSLLANKDNNNCDVLR